MGAGEGQRECVEGEGQREEKRERREGEDGGSLLEKKKEREEDLGVDLEEHHGFVD